MSAALFEGYATPVAPAPLPDPFTFGARVRYAHVVRRRVKTITRKMKYDAKRTESVDLKVWEVVPYDDRSGDGILIGKRTLVNGERDYLGYEEGIAFRPGESLTAYLVATDMRRNPVYVLPEHLELIEAVNE